MILIKAILVIICSAVCVSCTITGLNYMDPLNLKPSKSSPSEENPCNPLFWYPKNVPEYCQFLKAIPKPDQQPVPVPLPIPILQPELPLPMGPIFPAPLPYPMPLTSSLPFVPPISLSPVQINQQPMPLPYGIPQEPLNPMLPVAGVQAMPYPVFFPPSRYQQQAGLVPGIPGIVTRDGGINILPFSDPYADLLEKHKLKMIRKKFHKIIEKYQGFPETNRKTRRTNRHYDDNCSA